MKTRTESPARFAVVALVTCCAAKGVVLAGIMGVSLGAAASNLWVIAAAVAIVAVSTTTVVRRRSRQRRACCATGRVPVVGPDAQTDPADPSSTPR